jgi:predicted nucleic-acid-binding protein
MTNCLIDTNVWLRYVVGDDKKQYGECENFFDLVDDGVLKPYVSNVTLMETAFTLKSYYGFTKQRINSYLSDIFEVRNIVILEKTVSKEALALMAKSGVKYTDCLIAGQLKKDMVIVSYDKDFDKLVPGRRKEPGDLV